MSHSLFFVELGALVLGMAVLGRLAQRFGLSPIPFYLLGGLAFGPQGLFDPVDIRAFTDSVSVVGVLLLLLMLGLEYTPEELTGGLRRSWPAGLLDAVLNALPGYVAGLLLGLGQVGAIALAGVTWVTSSGISAKVITDLGRVGNRETPVVLSVLVMEDLAMAVYLPVIGALAAGVSLAAGLTSVAVAITVLVVVLWLALRRGAVLSRWVFTDSREALLLTVLGLTLLVAGIAESAKVSAAVAAFLVGIALSGEAAERAQPLLAPLRDLFAAIFFVAFGLSLDHNEVFGAFLPAVLLALVGVLTKILTGWYAARWAGIRERGRMRAGTALVARGEFSIVVAGLAGATVPRLGPIASAYVIITAVVGPVLTRYADQMADVMSRSRTGARGGDAPTGYDRAGSGRATAGPGAARAANEQGAVGQGAQDPGRTSG